jgi:hypothetical protein
VCDLEFDSVPTKVYWIRELDAFKGRSLLRVTCLVTELLL